MRQQRDSAELARTTLKRVTLMSNGANVGGVVVVIAFLLLLIPAGVGASSLALILERNWLGIIVFLAGAFSFAIAISRYRFRVTAGWLEAGSPPPSPTERRRVLGAPAFGFLLSLGIWSVGALALFLNNVEELPAEAFTLAGTVLLGGLTTAAITSLTVERAMQPVTARMLAIGPPQTSGRGVGRKLMRAWLLGTGVPGLGALFVGIGGITGELENISLVLPAAVFLVAVALGVGLYMIRSTARSVAEPIAGMRDALGQVEQGNFDARVKVTDGSEVGLLQAGFNRMAAGLAERERIREAFGTYVDRDVAERVLEEGTMLAGEELEVTVMFLDVRGFTAFVERESADEVVRTLNQLFELIVPIVHRHGGHVNKFLGDGLLAVFGAPRRTEEHADRALDAAAEIARAVRAEFGDRLEIGIGLNSGPVVAGNVGGAGRLEFSVVGDAVNVAARIESATRATGDTLLISADTRRRLRQEPPELEERTPQSVKGRAEPVEVCAVRF